MLDPEGFGFLILANGYRRAMRYDEALEVCRAGLENHPDYLSARVALALILLERGDREEAQSELETILEASPVNLLTRRVLANLYRENGNLIEAKKQFEEILWLVPGNAEALDALVSLDEEMAAGGLGPKKDPESSVETALVAEGEPAVEVAEAEEAEDVPLIEAEEGDLQDDAAEGPVEEPASEAKGVPAGLQQSPFPELADMDMSDPMYTRTLARLYEEQGHNKQALVTYGMVLKESPDDEAIQQKIQELEQVTEFEKELSGSGTNLGSLISEETVQEGEAAKPAEEGLDSPSESLDLDEKDATEDDSALGAGPSLEDIGGDDAPSPTERELEPLEGSGPAEAELDSAETLQAEEEPALGALGDLEDLLGPEAEGPPQEEEEKPALGDLEDLLVSESESPQQADSPQVESDLAEREADLLSTLENVMSDLGEEAEGSAGDLQGVIEEDSALPSPEPPEEAGAKPAPGPDAGREATIDRLEGLLGRIRSKKGGS